MSVSTPSIRGIGKCVSTSPDCAKNPCARGVRRAILSGLVGDLVSSHGNNALMSYVDIASFGRKDPSKNQSKQKSNQDPNDNGKLEEIKSLLQTLPLCPYCFKELESYENLLQHWKGLHGIQTDKDGFQSKLKKDTGNLAKDLLGVWKLQARELRKLQKSDLLKLLSIHQGSLKAKKEKEAAEKTSVSNQRRKKPKSMKPLFEASVSNPQDSLGTKTQHPEAPQLVSHPQSPKTPAKYQIKSGGTMVNSSVSGGSNASNKHEQTPSATNQNSRMLSTTTEGTQQLTEAPTTLVASEKAAGARTLQNSQDPRVELRSEEKNEQKNSNSITLSTTVKETQSGKNSKRSIGAPSEKMIRDVQSLQPLKVPQIPQKWFTVAHPCKIHELQNVSREIFQGHTLKTPAYEVYFVLGDHGEKFLAFVDPTLPGSLLVLEYIAVKEGHPDSSSEIVKAKLTFKQVANLKGKVQGHIRASLEDVLDISVKFPPGDDRFEQYEKGVVLALFKHNDWKVLQSVPEEKSKERSPTAPVSKIHVDSIFEPGKAEQLFTSLFPNVALESPFLNIVYVKGDNNQLYVKFFDADEPTEPLLTLRRQAPKKGKKGKKGPCKNKSDLEEAESEVFLVENQRNGGTVVAVDVLNLIDGYNSSCDESEANPCSPTTRAAFQKLGSKLQFRLSSPVVERLPLYLPSLVARSKRSKRTSAEKKTVATFEDFVTTLGLLSDGTPCVQYAFIVNGETVESRLLVYTSIDGDLVFRGTEEAMKFCCDTSQGLDKIKDRVDYPKMVVPLKHIDHDAYEKLFLYGVRLLDCYSRIGE